MFRSSGEVLGEAVAIDLQDRSFLGIRAGNLPLDQRFTLIERTLNPTRPRMSSLPPRGSSATGYCDGIDFRPGLLSAPFEELSQFGAKYKKGCYNRL